MLTTRSRKQGSSVVVTLPSDKESKPEINKEYIVIYSEDGTIILVPKIDDPFAASNTGEFYEEDMWDDIAPEGREIL